MSVPAEVPLALCYLIFVIEVLYSTETAKKKCNHTQFIFSKELLKTLTSETASIGIDEFYFLRNGLHSANSMLLICGPALGSRPNARLQLQ